MITNEKEADVKLEQQICGIQQQKKNHRYDHQF
jgi:hypothetical protein